MLIPSYKLRLGRLKFWLFDSGLGEVSYRAAQSLEAVGQALSVRERELECNANNKLQTEIHTAPL